MAETTNTNDTDLLSRAGTEALEGAVDCDTGAQHRRGLRALQLLRNGVHPAKDITSAIQLDKLMHSSHLPVLVDTDVRAVATLSDVTSVHVLLAPGIDLVSAVGLVVVLALLALEAAVNLSTDTDTLADLCESDLVTDANDLADDLVADSKRVRARAPVTVDLVHVTGADTAALNLNVDILWVEGTRSEGVLLEIGPVLQTRRLESSELLRVVGHGEDWVFEVMRR